MLGHQLVQKLQLVPGSCGRQRLSLCLLVGTALVVLLRLLRILLLLLAHKAQVLGLGAKGHATLDVSWVELVTLTRR